MPRTSSQQVHVPSDILEGIPDPVQPKVRRYIGWLRDGRRWHEAPIRGTKLSCLPDRTAVSIKVDDSWRMLCVDDGDVIYVSAVVPREDCNHNDLRTYL